MSAQYPYAEHVAEFAVQFLQNKSTPPPIEPYTHFFSILNKNELGKFKLKTTSASSYVFFTNVHPVHPPFYQRMSFKLSMLIVLVITTCLYMLLYYSLKKNVRYRFLRFKSRIKEFGEACGEWYWELDCKGHLKYCSEGMLEYLESDWEEVSGTSADQAFALLCANDTPRSFFASAADGAFFRNEIVSCKKHRTSCTVQMTSIPILDEHGILRGSCGVARDITNELNTSKLTEKLQKQVSSLTSSLDQADSKAAEMAVLADGATTVKTDFLSRISHEVQTPVNAIIGSVSLLEQQNHNTEEDDCIEVIKESASMLC